MPRPRVHEAAGVPAEIEQELSTSFELVGGTAGADGVVTTPAIPVDAAFLDAAGPQLRIVANYAVGLDNIDFSAARERGVVVSLFQCTVPGRGRPSPTGRCEIPGRESDAIPS